MLLEGRSVCYRLNTRTYLVTTYLFSRNKYELFPVGCVQTARAVKEASRDGCLESKLEERLPGNVDLSQVAMRNQLLEMAASLWQRPSIRSSSSSLVPCSQWCDAPSCHIYRDLLWGENGED